jgi:hypothetical protein
MTPAALMVRCLVCGEPTYSDGTNIALCNRCRIPPDIESLPFSEPVNSDYGMAFWRAVARPEPDTAVYLDLQVNNASGQHTGHVDAIAFILSRTSEPLLELDGFHIVCRLEDRHRLRIGKCIFPILAYAEWSGSCTWDMAKISRRVAARIANVLRKQDANCSAGWERLFSKWHQNKRRFAHYDFTERVTD